MIDQTMISFILIFMVAPVAFLLWAVYSSVTALQRVARATEVLVDQRLGYAEASDYKRMNAPAHAYTTQQVGLN